MKIAYVGDFINHGKSLQTAGTSLVLLFSSIKDVEFIDVYCPLLNEKIKPAIRITFIPAKMHIRMLAL